jgi:hypothetical protein
MNLRDKYKNTILTVEGIDIEVSYTDKIIEGDIYITEVQGNLVMYTCKRVSLGGIIPKEANGFPTTVWECAKVIWVS